ncbi:MAG TPA: helix-turn-helix domain-containing protein, partial [Verrucomicrobiae bacterium]|nr:helix-turn-helix domain-containing protein [Verrucomicrobiae bacterium]
YRLNVFPITIPPLRERHEDISLVVTHLLGKFTREMGSPVRRLSVRVEELFRIYGWPGNVRELQNVIERAVNVAETEEIGIEDLPLYLVDLLERSGGHKLKTLEVELAETERRAIVKALKAVSGNKAKAAAVLGIHRTNLYRKMDRYGIRENQLNDYM